MKKENDLMESLLEEHARSKGVDEAFLRELEERIDAEESGNVIPLNQSGDRDRGKKRRAGMNLGLGLGVGAAACAAFYFSGALRNEHRKEQDVAMQSEAYKAQVNKAMNEVADEYALKSGRVAKPESKLELEVREKIAKPEMVDSVQKKPAAPSASMAKVIGATTPNTSSVPVPQPRSAESSLDFGDGNNFGDGWGGKSDSLRIGGMTQSEIRRRAGFVASPKKAKELTGALTLSDTIARKPASQENTEQYGKLIENTFTAPVDEKSRLSTFAIDVDTASYANVRRMIQDGIAVPADAVRIEEMVNYFDYQYAKPAQDVKHPFAVHVDAAVCPWNTDHKLVRVALQGKDIVREERPASNVVFLLDVSGSMNNSRKLPLLKSSLKYLLEEMNAEDKVSIVVYAGASGLILPATVMDATGQAKVLDAMDKLSAGGSTAGGAGIKLAYQTAKENFIKGGVNRVILATDGDFNVGVSDKDELKEIVRKNALSGVDLSVLGFGTGSLNDEMLEMITNHGNGNYSYIDSEKEGRKVLLEDMMGTLVTIAKDVKVQLEFNPERVKEYRLIGYSNRILPNAAFYDKRADAGEIGAGHRVTAFYEIIPGKASELEAQKQLRYAKKKVEKEAKPELEVTKEYRDELLFVKLAYKQPEAGKNDESTYLSVPLKDDVQEWDKADADFKFASSVALFGMVLRDSEHKGDGNIALVQKLAEAGRGNDGKGLRKEFSQLVNKMIETGNVDRIRR